MPEFNTKIDSPLPTFGPLDCPDVTLVFHINVSLLYMLFSDHCLNSTCYDIPYTLHKSKTQMGSHRVGINPHVSQEGTLARIGVVTGGTSLEWPDPISLRPGQCYWLKHGKNTWAAIMCSNLFMLGICDIIGRGDNRTICMNTWLGIGAWTL